MKIYFHFFLAADYNIFVETIPEDIKKYFWETDKKGLDLVKDSVYIAKRLIELGRPEAIKWAWKNLSRNDWQAALQSRDVSLVTKNFRQSLLGKKKN